MQRIRFPHVIPRTQTRETYQFTWTKNGNIKKKRVTLLACVRNGKTNDLLDAGVFPEKFITAHLVEKFAALTDSKCS
jgi:hypothetical protein